MLAVASASSCRRSSRERGPKSASLTRRLLADGDDAFAPRASLRDGVWVMDGDMLLDSSRKARGVVHYGKAWPGGRVPFRFSPEEEFRGDHESREAVRKAVAIVRQRTELDWTEIPSDREVAGGFVEVRFWDKRWGSAQVGYVGEKQVVNLPSTPSVRLTLHEFGHVMGLGHEHQHPSRDQFVQVDRSCVPEEHRDSFAPRSKHVVSRVYDIDSIMHYRSAGFCRKDKVDADHDGNTGECAYVDDDPSKGKCYALRRAWGACALDNCEDRDGDGFREYIRGASTLSDGDVRTIHTLHRNMLSPQWPTQSFGEHMIAADGDGDGQTEIYVAELHDGPCGALWELRPNADRTALVRHRSTPARWGCQGNGDPQISMQVTGSGKGKRSELWVGVLDQESAARGGWVEQWRRGAEGEMQLVTRLTPRDWGMEATPGFGHRLAVRDVDGDGLADLLAVGAPGQYQSGRVFYAKGIAAKDEGMSRGWAKVQGQLAGRVGLGQSLSWVGQEGQTPALVLSMDCDERDEKSCEPSLWRWSDDSPLRKVASIADLNLESEPGPLDMRTKGFADARGLWWMMPQACHRSGHQPCGGAWPLRGFGERFVLGGSVVRPGAGGPEDGIADMVAIRSYQGEALIVKGEDQRAWVAVSTSAATRWIEVPSPRGAAPDKARHYAGWWDAQGLYVVTAWNDLSGKRQLHLDRIPVEGTQSR